MPATHPLPKTHPFLLPCFHWFTLDSAARGIRGNSEQPPPEELFPKDALLLRLVFFLSNSPCVLGSLKIHQFLAASWRAMVFVFANRPGAAGKKATDESEGGG